MRGRTFRSPDAGPVVFEQRTSTDLLVCSRCVLLRPDVT